MAVLIRCKVCNECKPLAEIEFSKGEAVCKGCLRDKSKKGQEE